MYISKLHLVRLIDLQEAFIAAKSRDSLSQNRGLISAIWLLPTCTSRVNCIALDETPRLQFIHWLFQYLAIAGDNLTHENIWMHNEQRHSVVH